MASKFIPNCYYDNYQIQTPAEHEDVGGPAAAATSLFNSEVLNMVPPGSDAVWPGSMVPFSGSLVSISGMDIRSEFNAVSSPINGSQNLAAGNQLERCYDHFPEECGGILSNFWPVYPVAGDSWGIQSKAVPEIEETTLKIGKYSVEERKDRILRYLKKRSQRNFNKTIKYACRKTLADKRVRIRGRFARNNEPSEDEAICNKNNDACEEKELFYQDAAQVKEDEEDWLQETLASFMYLPYVAQ